MKILQTVRSLFQNCRYDVFLPVATPEHAYGKTFAAIQLPELLKILQNS